MAGFLTHLAAKTGLSKTQLVLTCIFLLIILVGQIMAHFSPDETIHNYFTSKGNLVNKFYVKMGWFWTLTAYSNLIYQKLKRRRVERSTIINSLFRVIFITIGWYLFTQWCFGLPIMDRVFLWTGGKCMNVYEPNIPSGVKNLFSKTSNLEEITYDSSGVSSATCRSVKGVWFGGHDPSGHVFLLTLSASLLLNEFFHLYNIQDDNILDEYLKNKMTNFGIIFHHVTFTVIFSLMAFGMLLMTVIKYHSLVEQIAGFCVALIVIWISNQLAHLTR